VAVEDLQSEDVIAEDFVADRLRPIIGVGAISEEGGGTVGIEEAGLVQRLA